MLSISPPSTPTRKRRSTRIAVEEHHTPSLVTPAAEDDNETQSTKQAEGNNNKKKVGRQLVVPQGDDEGVVEIVTPNLIGNRPRKTCFGRIVSSNDTTVQANTRQVYARVNKMTGSIGGNGKCIIS